MVKRKDVVFTGFALFAMLFGAGNLIFPPMLGHNLGSSWGIAALGFVVTGVGFPLLGLIAAVHTGPELDDFAKRVSPLFARSYITILILTIGFFLAMPRTGATAYEMTLQNVGDTNPIHKYIFLVCYFLITWMFSLRANKVVERIGSILTPVLLIILAVIMYQGIFHPFSVPETVALEEAPFKIGFIQGYQTMDTLATIVYSAVIMKSIRHGRNLSQEEESSFLWKSSLIAVGLLACVYGALTYIGATFSGIETVGNTDLLSQIVRNLLGDFGNIILGLAVAGACLTTAIGLVATVGDYFEKILPFSYRTIVTVTCIAGFVFSNFGVQTIIQVAIPILVVLYPISMMLIFLNLLQKYMKNDMVYRIIIVLTTMFGLYQAYSL
ncbi:branched-chain amino acid transport system II carrier protein [Fusobacterium gonidiaformans]|uniref:branched-chain amino acid transport system II carrier protein n=1 Tax=Fusobacterium gonidiaformans TaxID=849 RepID=UPI0001BC67C3|nr:branched-chain amino acid transport system II carrier protein [Fusobacterium gonidiaformans]AVQ16528.1 branched-chain amino acid transport system II carrier protein [Fusobacterium gonidiaformans ATCC 25563]EFS29209.1 branched-chain amino acid transport system II carrier protein [Fusobacterium gonidiaformans ATCC 25563]